MMLSGCTEIAALFEAGILAATAGCLINEIGPDARLLTPVRPGFPYCRIYTSGAGHGYTNRSEAMRDLIRSSLVAEQWQQPDAKVVASLSIVYDHRQHVHLDNQLCLENILMQGPAERLRRLADDIIATRDVKTGKLTLLSGDL
jgi:CopG family nickel-responsive transcriptional regulator